MAVFKGKSTKQEPRWCSAGEQNLISNGPLLPYTKELENVKNRLRCSEHRLGDSENTFCWVDTSQPNVPHYSLCTQDLQEWAKYLVRILLYASKQLLVTPMNFSMMLESQTTPALLYPAHPILMTSARHARKETHRFSVCPPSPSRPSSILISISHPSTIHGLLTVHSPNKKIVSALRWLLNHSREHLHSISRVMKKPMVTNRSKRFTASLRAFILAILPWTSCSMRIHSKSTAYCICRRQHILVVNFMWRRWACRRVPHLHFTVAFVKLT